ncbi:MAG: TatD family hydrolase [Bacteroidaceae bacterium]|nr:TatD family hydrolase [Bacteroidaceae bacterium]
MTPFPDFMSIPMLPLHDMDCHTHHLLAPAGRAIVNVPMEWLLHSEKCRFVPGAIYSVGIHPLFEGDWERAFLGLNALMELPQVQAMGECGLDHRCRATLPQQEAYFRRQMQLAANRQFPLIIHCVGCWAELLRLHKECPSAGVRIIHGFRGKPQLAQQLLKAGFQLSFGPKFNATSLLACPETFRYAETDDSGLSLAEVQAIHSAAALSVQHI